MSKRKPMSKKLRFEVFKRDSFTCQYCGNQAPDVILHVDHIKPVAKNGSNDILNLITSCSDCNFGKGARELSDDAEIRKQQSQLNDLNERRNQLEQMIEWRKGLAELDNDTLDHVSGYWDGKMETLGVTESGKKTLKAHIKKFGVSAVLDAIDIAAEKYFKYNGDGLTNDSADVAFRKIGGICYYKANPGSDRFSPEAFYVRGILRNRLSYVNEKIIMFVLAEAQNNNVNMDSVKELAKSCSTWTQFINSMNAYNDQYGGEDDG